jgi:microcystin-dependent protein
MGQPFIGEIRMFGGNFAPAGWALCHGQLLAISENDALFTLIGTTYGGDGQETFALPDLRGRIPIHMGAGPSGTTYIIGEAAGVESVTLSTQQIPNHTHAVTVSTDPPNQPNPGGNVLAASNVIELYSGDPPDSQLNAGAVVPTGGSQPHENMMPFLCVNFIISLFGIFPQQT